MRGSPRLPSTSPGAGTARRARSSAAIDEPLWRDSHHNPDRRAARRRARAARGAGPRRRFLLALRRGDGLVRAGAVDARAAGSASTTPTSAPTARSPTSAPSSGCIPRCRSTPAASACSPAITARRRRISPCRSSASASSTRRATSTSGSRRTAGRRIPTKRSIPTPRRWFRSLGADGTPWVTVLNTFGRAVHIGAWTMTVGRAPLYLLDTDLEVNRRGRPRRSPASSTRAAPRCGCGRSGFSAPAACACCARSGSIPPPGTPTRGTPRS